MPVASECDRVTIFGDKVFTKVIKVKLGIWVGPTPI